MVERKDSLSSGMCVCVKTGMERERKMSNKHTHEPTQRGKDEEKHSDRVGTRDG